jgi:FKBP-type peptidyl-prolyl cis-trans isomerase (trigger factor)
MSDSPVIHQPNGTIEIQLTLPWTSIQAEFEHQVQSAVSSAELPGFRKGKAPRNLVEPKLDKNHLYSHAVQHLLPEMYADFVKTHNLKPILYPRIQITSGEEGKDWQFTATTCEAPTVVLDKYLDELKQISTEPKDTLLSRRVEKLLEISHLEIPSLLIEEEVNHRLGSLADNLTKLGLTTENYLQTKKLTSDTLRAQLSSEATHDLQIEFVLGYIQTDQKLADRNKVLEFLTNLV